MIIDIFSSFDPASFISLNKSSSILLTTSIIIILLIQLPFWSINNRISSASYITNSIIYNQLSNTYRNSLKGTITTITPLFSSIILINLVGLNPYSFRLSSHLIFTLTFGLPLWISFILSSYTKQPKASIAHLLPDGAPDWLNPFLILIETTRILVRPLTLSFRLAANMRAGHIVLGLIRIYRAASIFNSTSAFATLFSLTVFYVLFEVAICLIQAYIFCLLLSLYANDHAH